MAISSLNKSELSAEHHTILNKTILKFNNIMSFMKFHRERFHET